MTSSYPEFKKIFDAIVAKGVNGSPAFASAGSNMTFQSAYYFENCIAAEGMLGDLPMQMVGVDYIDEVEVAAIFMLEAGLPSIPRAWLPVGEVNHAKLAILKAAL